MKYAIIVLALVGVLARPTAAIAEATGNEILQWCKQLRQICTSYAGGWRSGHWAVLTAAYYATRKIPTEQKQLDAQLKVIKRTAPTNICIPRVVTNGQLADILMNHLRAHPETRHLQVGYLIVPAFRKAFPCR